MKRTVDAARLRAALHRLTRRDLLVVLDRALAHVPKHQAHEIVEGFIAFDQIAVITAKSTRALDRLKTSTKRAGVASITSHSA